MRRVFGRRLDAFGRFVGLVGRDIHDGGAELRRKIDEVRHRLRFRRVRGIGKLGPEVRGAGGVESAARACIREVVRVRVATKIATPVKAMGRNNLFVMCD